MERSLGRPATDDASLYGLDLSITAAPTGTGALDGQAFTAKEVFDLAGHVTRRGHPEWERTHAVASGHAECVALLLSAGAKLVARSLCDELAFSLDGENLHYGTPCNPAAPGHVAGGSSSGAASGLAGGWGGIALGTDTAGSVRVPAAYCGLFGFRPTHGHVSVRGVVPLAPRFDTVGWMARDADTLLAVGSVLLPAPATGGTLRRLMCVESAFAAAEEGVRHRLRARDAALRQYFDDSATARDWDLAAWSDVFRVLQLRDVWDTHGDWVRKHTPVFAPAVAQRMAAAQALSNEEWAASATAAVPAIASVLEALREDTVLLLPTVPHPAPRTGASQSQSTVARKRTISLTCIAGLAGLPQVTLPVDDGQGLPIGLSLIGPRGSDLALLALAADIGRGGSRDVVA